MKIKTKLRISAVLSIGITVVISVILFLASRRVDNAVRQSSSVQNIVTKVFESNLLLNDFLLRHGERAELQWQKNHKTLGSLLATLTLDDAQEQGILNQVQREHKKTTALFSELVEGNKEQRRNRDEIISFLELEEKVAAELSSRSRAMVSHAAALADLSQARAVAAQRQGSILVVVFTAAVTLVLAVTLVTIAGAVVNPITKLTEATRIIADGNLEHKVDVTGDDEIGMLASAFNEMTRKLKDSYTGLQDAFNEMARKLRKAKKELEERQREEE